MVTPAVVNTVFEIVGCVLAWYSVLLAARTRPVGVSAAAMAWSGLWAANCVFYYADHGEIPAAWLAVLRCAAMGAWLVLASRRS